MIFEISSFWIKKKLILKKLLAFYSDLLKKKIKFVYSRQFVFINDMINNTWMNIFLMKKKMMFRVMLCSLLYCFFKKKWKEKANIVKLLNYSKS